MEDIAQILFLFLLLLLSGFFSSAETALMTANKIRIKALADEGNANAKTMLRITEESGKMLSAILVGNNIVNLYASSLSATLTIRLFGSKAVGISTGILTLLVLIFGELTPKTMAQARADQLALAYSPIVQALMYILTPVIFIVEHLSRFVLILLRIDPDAKEETITEQELRTLVDVGHEDGVLESDERTMILNVFDFGDAQAKDIMVPRADMISVSSDDRYETVYNVFRLQKFSRLPVYENDRDNIVGIINIKDFLFVTDRRRFTPAEIMYEPHFTFETKKASDLMLEMRDQSIPLSIVLDEYGQTVGMVTLEDLLEELVGQIRDEYDEDEKNLIRETAPGEYLIRGSVKLDDINDALHTNLESEDFDSIGGLIIGLLGHLPHVHETVTLPDGDTLTVERMKRHRITSVRFRHAIPAAEDTEAVKTAQDTAPEAAKKGSAASEAAKSDSPAEETSGNS